MHTIVSSFQPLSTLQILGFSQSMYISSQNWPRDSLHENYFCLDFLCTIFLFTFSLYCPKILPGWFVTNWAIWVTNAFKGTLIANHSFLKTQNKSKKYLIIGSILKKIFTKNVPTWICFISWFCLWFVPMIPMSLIPIIYMTYVSCCIAMSGLPVVLMSPTPRPRRHSAVATAAIGCCVGGGCDY